MTGAYGFNCKYAGFNYSAALKMGYKPNGQMAFQTGYVSRKDDKFSGNRPVYIAGGTRKGQLFICIPNFNSSRYCIRVYLEKDGE